MSLQDFTTSRLPGGLGSIPARLFIGTIILFALIWIVIGLISLRFSLATNLADVAYSQLIVLGCLLVALANGYVMQSGGFNRDGEGSVWRFVAYCPVASSGTAIIGLLLLIWPVWTSFSRIEPNQLLQLMFTLITIGLCGTFVGFVSLAEVGRIYRYLPWGLYVLTVALAVEIGEGLWRVERLRADTTGEQAGMIGIVIVTAVVAYTIIAVAMANASTERSRNIALIWYFIGGIGGFTLGFFALLDSLEAGPHRVVLGLAMSLCIGAVGLALLHYYNHRAPGSGPQADSRRVSAHGLESGEREAPISNPADPYSPDNRYTPYYRGAADPTPAGEQQAAGPDVHRESTADAHQRIAPETPAQADVARCPGCGNPNVSTANFCRLCGLRLSEEP